jgi:hypothetical protein
MNDKVEKIWKEENVALAFSCRKLEKMSLRIWGISAEI